MHDLSRAKKAKMLLTNLKTPNNSFDLKYGGMNAKEAWDQFFHLSVTKFKNTYKVPAEGTKTESEILSDIHTFIDDTIIRMSSTFNDYRWLSEKFGTEEYHNFFRKHLKEIEMCVADLKRAAHECKQKATQSLLTHHSLYPKYEPYLAFLLNLRPEHLFDGDLPPNLRVNF